MGFIDYFDGQYQYLRRYNQIISVLMKYGFEDLVGYMQEKKRFSFVYKLLPKSTLQQSLKYTKWEKMRMVCEELGPTFVKFGQILSSRADLLPIGLILELEKLQDGVPPVNGELAVLQVEKELGKPVSELFESFETNCFASASIAQVHRATLKTGEEVVVKIQRPDIDLIIQQDIKVMNYVASILVKRIPSIKSFDPIGLIKNFEESIIKEMDFINESISNQRFSRNFEHDKKNDGFTIAPKVYRNLTTSKVLTQEFVKGTKMISVMNDVVAGFDKKLLAERLIHSYFQQVFKHGFFHADPHPGNLIIMPENRICFIDYGMMGSIMPKDLQQIANIFIAIKNKNVRKLIRSVLILCDTTTIKHFRIMEADVDTFINKYDLDDSANSSEISTILLDLKDIIVKHKLKTPTHFYLLARSLVTVEGVARNLNPDIDAIEIVKPYLFRKVSMQYNPLKFAKNVFNSIYELGMYMEEFPRDLKNAIRKINTGEIK
jgi:ubiquinone biosynthesis protein